MGSEFKLTINQAHWHKQAGTNKFRGCSAAHVQRSVEDHAHVQRHAEVAMVKNGVNGRLARLARARRRQRMSEVALTIAQGLPAAFKLGENHLPCVLPIRVNLIIGTFMQLFCMAMAWSSAHTGLLPVVMYVCKSMESVAGS